MISYMQLDSNNQFFTKNARFKIRFHKARKLLELKTSQYHYFCFQNKNSATINKPAEIYQLS